MLENFLVSAQLAASKEGLSSMELVTSHPSIPSGIALAADSVVKQITGN
jgi:hypothetical protein